jgi:hypothetical protein
MVAETDLLGSARDSGNAVAMAVTSHNLGKVAYYYTGSRPDSLLSNDWCNCGVADTVSTVPESCGCSVNPAPQSTV